MDFISGTKTFYIRGCAYLNGERVIGCPNGMQGFFWVNIYKGDSLRIDGEWKNGDNGMLYPVSQYWIEVAQSEDWGVPLEAWMWTGVENFRERQAAFFRKKK